MKNTVILGALTVAGLSAGAAGAISGSAVVKIIETHAEQPQIMLDKLGEFVSAMKAATQK